MIPQTISELLLRFDTVVLPGMGTFNLQKVSAEIRGDIIIPPGKKLHFDSLNKNNDGVLANCISEKERISFFDACAKILEYVEGVQQKMKAGERVLLDKIGALEMDGSGKIIFTADLTTIYNIDSFGLSNIHAAPFSKTDEMEIRQNAATMPAGKKKRFPRAAIWIMIAVLFIGTGIAGVYFLKPELLQKIGFMKRQVELNNTNPDTPEKVTDTIKLSQSDASVQNVQSDSTIRYFIIAASFRIKSNADNYVIQLNQQGYKSESIYLPEKKLYAVSQNVYYNMADAEQALSAFKATGNTAAWILEK